MANAIPAHSKKVSSKDEAEKAEAPVEATKRVPEPRLKKGKEKMPSGSTRENF